MQFINIQPLQTIPNLPELIQHIPKPVQTVFIALFPVFSAALKFEKENICPFCSSCCSLWPLLFWDSSFRCRPSNIYLGHQTYSFHLSVISRIPRKRVLPFSKFNFDFNLISAPLFLIVFVLLVSLSAGNCFLIAGRTGENLKWFVV